MDPDQVAGLRRAYGARGLAEDDLAADPFAQFGDWLATATREGVTEPNAMVLGTVGDDGQPSARTVLLKGFDASGFVFFTHYGSRKGRELAGDPRASLVFPWYVLERQVAVVGTAERVARAETEAYFASRPRGSRLGAWASPQSSVVSGRAALDDAYASVARRFEGVEDVPAPTEWGGFRIVPATVEFWQGRQDRMHDRLRYRRDGDGWRVERLAP